MEKKRSYLLHKKLVGEKNSMAVPSETTNPSHGVRSMSLGMGFCATDDMVFFMGQHPLGLCAGVVEYRTAEQFFTRFVELQ
jgi:hypothetical protein